LLSRVAAAAVVPLLGQRPKAVAAVLAVTLLEL
jgi:hypothetical protein